MPRSQRDGHSTLAKSLPVTVPAFPSIVRRAVQDQNDDQVKFYKIFNFCNISVFFLVYLIEIYPRKIIYTEYPENHPQTSGSDFE